MNETSVRCAREVQWRKELCSDRNSTDFWNALKAVAMHIKIGQLVLQNSTVITVFINEKQKWSVIHIFGKQQDDYHYFV